MALEIPIRWRDIDALGHVNNAVYYSYVEELLAAVLDPVLGAGWVTTRVELDFRRELRLTDGRVLARATVEDVGDGTATVNAVLELPDGTVALDGRVVVAACDPETRRPRPLSAAERRGLEGAGV